MKRILINSAIAIALLAGSALASAPVEAGSIYDSNAEKLLKLSPVQRKKVVAIIRQSDAAMQAVFRKHGINPHGPVIFDKLVSASGELQAIESREKRAMKKVLNAKQMAHYKRLLELTAIRVRKAAR